jgi:hypothetical protein
MSKKNSDTLNQQSTATDIVNSNNVRIKKQLKIERFAELLLQGGLTGIARWTVLGKQKSTNPGTFASSLRQLGINITKGQDYILKDLSSAHATVSFINTQRADRNAEPLSNDVIEYWLKPFIDAQNEVAA